VNVSVIATEADDEDTMAMTVLHVAACYGLVSFAEQLSTLPAAAAAALVMNSDRQTPSNLARCHGNVTTADVIDRLTNQRTAYDSAISEYRPRP